MNDLGYVILCLLPALAALWVLLFGVPKRDSRCCRCCGCDHR